ncbi:T9SS type B sorting domain-containing protein [Lacinutrix sp. WUR7]|uniref:Ig-like domain-containing protein n=1 Tax=Lacinutrix sp. WUR7 TaxID=2653681 RepID=UPI00193DA7AB|nr:Ig-like domain-containing protein [Lacinutrix sp. WUR7]QRM87936.1 T9SS type B sorting domain-containing protein [Lacinutrix sp. WUR7]
MKRLLSLFSFFLVQFLCAQVGNQMPVSSGPGSHSLDMTSSNGFNLDCVTTCTDLTASFTEYGSTDTYTVQGIDFNPRFNFSGLANQVFFDGGVYEDDQWSVPIDLPFDFCFFGDSYDQVQVGGNGVIRFDVNAGDTSNWWSFNETLPNNSNPTLSEPSIFGAAHDLDPRIGDPSLLEIGWEIKGEAPFRAFIYSYFNVPHYGIPGTPCNNLRTTQMMIFYETTNIIEVLILDKPSCADWNNGNAVIGIQNNAGTVAYTPPNRNTGDWATSLEAWQFVPSDGTPSDNYTFSWLDDTGAVISNNLTLSVCPTVTTTYTAQVEYTPDCGFPMSVVTRDVTVNVNIGAIITGDLSICEGETTQLAGSGIPSATTPWVSSDTAVATVDNTGLVTGVSPGTADITYSDNTGCVGTVTVTINPILSPSISCGTSTTSSTQFNWPGIPGATGYTISYQINGNPIVNIGNIGNILTYTATSTASDPIVAGDNVTITVSPLGGAGTCFEPSTFSCTANNCTAPTITGTLNACLGQTTQLTGSGTANATTPWVSSDTGVATIDASGLVTSVTSGTSDITYTDDNGCDVTVTVTINPILSPAISCGTSTTTSTQFNWNTIVGTTSYTVSYQINGNPVVNIGDIGNFLTYTATSTASNPIVAGDTVTITVTPVGGTGTCFEATTFTCTAMNCTTPTITGTLSACEGETTQLTGSGTANTTAPWVSSDTAIATVDNTGLVTGVSDGIVGITYTDDNGCVVTENITINATPTITGTLSACEGDTTQLTGDGTANVTTPWVSSDTAVATVDGTGLVTGVTSGTADITYTNDIGCDVTVTVTINATPTITGTLSACLGATTQLTGSGTANATTPWVSLDTGVATVDASGLVTSVTSGTSDITYTDDNGCDVTETVTINPILSPAISCGTSTTTSTQFNWNTIAGATSYTVSYQINGNPVVNIGDIGNFLTYTATSTASNPIVAGDTVTITVTPVGGTGTCFEATTFTCTAMNCTTPTITGTLSACEGDTTQLTGSGTANTTTPWVSSDIAIATVDNTGLVTGISDGTVGITYTDDNGCVVTENVTINATPTITGTLSACEGDTTQLTGDGTANATTPWVSSDTAVATVDGTGLVTGVTSGTADITYTNDAGCVVTETVTINATPTITGTLRACLGSTTQLTGSGTANATAPWISSDTGVATVDTSGLVTGVTSGTSDITYTDANGCTATVTVTIDPILSPSVSCGTSTTTSTQFNWNTIAGATSYTVSYQINGNPVVNIGDIGNVLTYTATSTASDPIVASDSVIVTVTPIGGAGTCFEATTFTCTAMNCTTPIVTGTFSACIGDTTQLTGNGTASATTPWASSDTAIATVDNTGLVTGISDGTVGITYTDDNGCVVTENVTINATPTITGTLSVCSGLTSQLAGSGTANATTPWISSDTAVATIDNAGLVTAVSIGTADITYTDANGCDVTVTVTINALPTITGTLSACEGDTTTLTGSGTASATTPWVSSDATIATVDNSGVVTGVSTGTADITYTDANGCDVTATVTINVTPTITGTLSACEGDVTQLTGSGIANATTPWISSDTAVATVDNTGLVTGVSNGTTDITYTSDNGCDVTVTVTINGIPTISGNVIVCEGTDTQLTGSGTAGATTPWVSSDTAIATVSNTGLVTGVSAGTADITYADANGCDITVTVTINATPTITGVLSVCTGDNTMLTGSGTANVTAPWVSSDTAIATVDNTGLVTGVSSGSADITYTDSNDCTVTVTVAVTVPTITGTLSACLGFTTQLTGSGTANATAPWISSDTAIATVDNTGLVTGVSAGTADITYTDANGCDITVTVTINATPTITGTLIACEGDTTSLTGSATASATNPWISSDTAIATVDNAGLVTGVSAGSADITYTDSNGCDVTVTVTINATPTITGTLSACEGDFTQLIGSGIANATTPWVSSNMAVATVDNTGLVTGVSNGTSNITYTSDNGCDVTVTVTINAIPTISGNLIICEGSDSQLAGSGTAGATTPWVSSDTAIATVSNTGLVTGVSAGTADITYADANGCDIMVTVTINATPTITGVLSVCIEDDTQLTGSGTASTTNPWVSSDTTIATIDNTGLVTGVNGGTVDITYTDSNGCSAVETFTVDPRPIVDLQDTFILCMDNDGNIVNDPTIETGLSTVDYSFAWTEAANPTTILGTDSYYEPILAGTYSVFITNNNTGCVTVVGDPNTISVVTNSIPPTGLDVVILSETFASENVLQASVDNIPGASYEFSIDNGPFESNGTNVYTFGNVSSGDHTITVRDADGCGDDDFTIFVLDYPLFFTPNNDGHNDTWQISGINPDAVIYIFDRYGKLLKQLSPTSLGWDGTFNGQPLPSSDYWFSLEYIDPNDLEDTSVKEFMAHFTLKR